MEKKKEMKRVSYSQYSMHDACPWKYKLKYIDKLSASGGSRIHLIFGSAFHEVIQEYLSVLYNATQTKAEALDLFTMLTEKMREHYIRVRDEINEDTKEGDPQKIPCTKEEMVEFLGDGREILKWFARRKNRIKFYAKKGYKLLGIEFLLDFEIKPNLRYVGYIDVIMKDTFTGKIKIIDIKTSTKGWNKWAKADKSKSNQILLYKKFYSDLKKVPLEKIDVEFHIVKRKLYEDIEFIQHRFQRFVPANGKPSTNKAYASFMEFVDRVFDENGERRTDIEYKKIAGRNDFNCTYCDFGPQGDQICNGP